LNEPAHCSTTNYYAANTFLRINTYISCTGTKRLNANSSDDCVVGTAQRINWVPLGYQINAITPKCPKSAKVIRHLIMYNIISFLCALANNRSLYKLPFRPWTVLTRRDLKERGFELNMVGFWLSIGFRLGETLLVASLLHKQDSRINLIIQTALWAVRPRAASLVGTLGFLSPDWTGHAFSNMVADQLLGLFGGTFILLQAGNFQHGISGIIRSTNPARPVGANAFTVAYWMLALPYILVLCYFILLMNAMFTCCCCFFKVRAAKAVTSPLWGLLYLLFIKLFCQMGIFILNLKRRLKKEPRVAFDKFELRGLMFWSYLSLWVSSLLFYVGSWLFVKWFFVLSDELYCPSELHGVDAIYALSPIILNLITASMYT
jgi:hypothetical protein